MPAFSRDGKWLAYASTESGRSEVFVRPFPAGERAIRISTDGGHAPLWSWDGRQLFYRTLPTEFRDQDKMMVVSVTTGSTFTRSPPRMLFGQPYAEAIVTRNYDVTRDGQAFLMLPEVGGDPEPATEIQVVLNWFEELKELVPVP